ncbi:unnamed protein product [Rotaria magnacalcarata]|uniref:Uncharacterized protein n=1 Tax=Rotaria magnacalcarata TaxID=392030 RepID=A0A816P7W2_9BILA|nr:unnamed protein product [Rotaria magnacalcarata]CAF2066331.1 unnamed protein product [Rotaria magnacalcarata]CAF3758853.1 unnamed protein product [Rotaria magnacalcarata]CAF3968031.1 unnamed protein product [Rotaria magnacalcarata]
MFASDKLGNIYESLVDKCIELSHSQTKFYFNQSIRKVTLTNVYTDSNQFNGSFYFIIFACDAETVLEKPSKIQQAVLGSIQYFDDVTYTHTDLDYIKTHYNVHLEFDQYFIHSNMKDSRRPLEMSFNLSN